MHLESTIRWTTLHEIGTSNGLTIPDGASDRPIAFADFGNATYGGLSSLMSLKSDVGVGFRMGLPRTPKNLLRLDFSYALNRDPLGRRGWLVSFSSGQAF